MKKVIIKMEPGKGKGKPAEQQKEQPRSSQKEKRAPK